jgi:adenylate kinase
MSAGELVPDQLILEMVAERLGRPDARGGFVLDGFPRTVEQAVALESELREARRAIAVVLQFEVSDAEVIRRLAGRRMCAAAGHVYHAEFDPPSRPGRCDHDGSELVQRDDDRPTVIENRLRVYRTSTQPLADYYGERGLLRRIEAAGEPQRVAAEVETALTTSLPSYPVGRAIPT